MGLKGEGANAPNSARGGGAIQPYDFIDATVHDLSLAFWGQQAPTDFRGLCIIDAVDPVFIGDISIESHVIGASNLTVPRYKGMQAAVSVLACGAGTIPLTEQAEPLMFLDHGQLEYATRGRKTIGTSTRCVSYSIGCDFDDYGLAPVELMPGAKFCAVEFPRDVDDTHARGVLTQYQVHHLEGAIPLRPITLIQVWAMDHGTMMEAWVVSDHYYLHEDSNLCQRVRGREKYCFYPDKLALAFTA